jgi:hypothetical protein
VISLHLERAAEERARGDGCRLEAACLYREGTGKVQGRYREGTGKVATGADSKPLASIEAAESCCPPASAPHPASSPLRARSMMASSSASFGSRLPPWKTYEKSARRHK